MTVQIAVRADALHQGVDRHDQHATLHRRQLVQRREARGDNFLMRRETIVGQRLPVREVHDHLIGKLTDFIMQAQRVLHIGRDEHDRTSMTFGNFCHQCGTGSSCKFTQQALVARFHG